MSRYHQLETVFVTVLWATHCAITGAQSASASRPVIEYSMQEELPVNSFVADLLRDANFSDRYRPADIQRFRFQIRSSNAKFSIDERLGVIRNGEVLDREALCSDGASLCQLSFDVAVRPSQFFQIIKVIVLITDVNDNSPTFPEEQVTVRIAETTSPGTLFLLPTADDADSGEFGVRQYQLIQREHNSATDDNFPFDLQGSEQPGETVDVKLRLTGSLDRELKTSYLLTVVALDGGHPAKSSELSVLVLVLDANDNHPVFNQTSYNIEVSEDAAPGTSLIGVYASDADQGPNARVSYSLPEHVERSHGHLFRIDEQSGVIYLRAPVDYERARVYHLTVAATDNGTPPSLPVFTKVTVAVLDVNDNRPSIAINILTDSGMAEVRENIDQAGTFVAHVAARDADSGDNGRVGCQLEDGLSRETPLFRLEPLFDETTLAVGASVEYKIATTTTFDREQRADYWLTITCQDNGLPTPLMTSRELQVRVLDENDNNPRLNSTTYWITVHENNQPGTEIFRINASDADTGSNAVLSYSMRPLTDTSSTSPSQEVLTIDSTSGRITTQVSFDYESEPRDFVYIVTVSDQGDVRRSATATVRLTVADINDEKPRFERSTYYLTTAESQPIGTSVGRVNATDGDRTAKFNNIYYDILRVPTIGLGTVDADSFAIDKFTGTIRSVKKLDREHQAIYVFTVVASNDVTPVTSRAQSDFTDFADVTVYVDDVNDHRPVFVFPGSQRGRTVELPARYMVGSLVTRLEATDVDIGPNAELQYAILSGHDDHLFDIDPFTGVITVGGGLDSERVSSTQQIRLVVAVSDKGNPPLQTVADLFIVVNDTGTMAETAKLATGETGEGSMSTAIIAIVGAAAGGALVIVCVIIVAVTVCIMKRKARRRQQPEKQQQSRDGLDAVSSLGGASSTCCQHAYRSASIIKPSSSSGYVREPGPGDDGSIVTCKYHLQPGQVGSVRSSLSSISNNQRRPPCHWSRDQVDDVIEHLSEAEDFDGAPSMKISKCRHHVTVDSGYNMESPDTDRASSTGTERPYSPVNQQVINTGEDRHHQHRPHSRHRHHHHSHHHHDHHQSQQPASSCHSCNCAHPHRIRNTDKKHQSDDVLPTKLTAGLTVALLSPSRDSESTCSCSCSCADSGRGPSEDDDHCQICRLGRHCLIANTVDYSCCDDLGSPVAV